MSAKGRHSPLMRMQCIAGDDPRGGNDRPWSRRPDNRVVAELIYTRADRKSRIWFTAKILADKGKAHGCLSAAINSTVTSHMNILFSISLSLFFHDFLLSLRISPESSHFLWLRKRSKMPVFYSRSNYRPPRRVLYCIIPRRTKWNKYAD